MTQDEKSSLDTVITILLAVGGWVVQWMLSRSQGSQAVAAVVPMRSGDVTVALTGVSATCHAGQLTPKITYTA